jgi:hypothetical protein
MSKIVTSISAIMAYSELEIVTSVNDTIIITYPATTILATSTKASSSRDKSLFPSAVTSGLLSTSCGAPGGTQYTPKSWNDAGCYSGGNNITTIDMRIHTTGCPCTGYRGACIDG